MNSSPEVSIIMPCWRCGPFLERSVGSVSAQSFENWELIAIDDGSGDDTLEHLQHLARSETRMRVLTQENRGVSATRNRGIREARGRWLFFLDADDHLTCDALAHLMSLTSPERDIVCGAYRILFRDEGGRMEDHVCARGDRKAIYESLIRGDSALNSMCARLYLRSMILEAGILVPENIRVGEDVIFNLYAFRAARGWIMSDHILYLYERGGDSAMTRSQGRRYDSSLAMFAAIDEFLTCSNLRGPLFRASMDLHLRTLRVDHGRLKAGFAWRREWIRRLTSGVKLQELTFKEKGYFLGLILCPPLSVIYP